MAKIDKPKILVVDDDKGVLDVLSMMLTRAGYHPITSSHYEFIPDRKFMDQMECCFLDMQTPTVSGEEWVRMNSHYLKRPKLIGMSGMPDAWEDTGLVDIIMKKPFNYDTLLNCIEYSMELQGKVYMPPHARN